MKLRWYDRVLIALGGVVFMGLGVAVMLAGGGVIRAEWFGLDYWVGTGWQWMPIIFLGGVLLFAWGVRLLVRPFMRASEKQGRYYTVRDGGQGEVHISVQALDHLVHKALTVWPEILTAQVRIGGQEDAMNITLRATLQSNVRIPELIRDVQSEIKQYVEECAGVKVQSVKVVIELTKDTRGQQPSEIKLLSQPPEPRNIVEPERIFAVREPEVGEPEKPETVEEPETMPERIFETHMEEAAPVEDVSAEETLAEEVPDEEALTEEAPEAEFTLDDTEDIPEDTEEETPDA